MKTKHLAPLPALLAVLTGSTNGIPKAAKALLRCWSPTGSFAIGTRISGPAMGLLLADASEVLERRCTLPDLTPKEARVMREAALALRVSATFHAA